MRGWGNGAVTVPLGTDFGVVPLAVASQSKRWGSDGGWARLLAVTPSSVDAVIDEDVACDTERGHTSEEVSVLAVSGPCVL